MVEVRSTSSTSNDSIHPRHPNCPCSLPDHLSPGLQQSLIDLTSSSHQPVTMSSGANVRAPASQLLFFRVRILMLSVTGPPLVSSRPRCRIRFLPPNRHHCCRQAPREPKGLRAQAVSYQPGPSRVPEEDCSQIKVWWYVASHSPTVSADSLTHIYSRHRPQRPQVRLRILAQVGPIDNSSCIFFPIDPANSPIHDHTRRMPVF